MTSLDGNHELDWKWGHIVSNVAHQYSRVDFYLSVEVNLSLYYGGVVRGFVRLDIHLFIYRKAIWWCASILSNWSAPAQCAVLIVDVWWRMFDDYWSYRSFDTFIWKCKLQICVACIHKLFRIVSMTKHGKEIKRTIIKYTKHACHMACHCTQCAEFVTRAD